MKRRYTEAIGWYGFAAILGSYAASNLGYLAVHSGLYQFLNVTGAAAFLVDSWPDRNWQVIALNTIWIGIAVIAVIAAFR